MSFDLVDAAGLADAALETLVRSSVRVRMLPSRVVVYLLLAAALFAEIEHWPNPQREVSRDEKQPRRYLSRIQVARHPD